MGCYNLIMENKENGIKVLVYGTFDMLHSGHFNLIYKASKLGKVHIALRPRAEVLVKKGVETFYDDNFRKESIERLVMVESVDLAPWDVENTVRLCKKYDIDYIVAGTDHLDSEIHKESERISGAKVIFFDRTIGISSTELRGMQKK